MVFYSDERIEEIVDKYMNEIKVEKAGMGATDDSPHIVYLSLNVPISMLEEYQRVTGIKKLLSNGSKFWAEGDFLNKLENCVFPENILPKDVILGFLSLNVDVMYEIQEKGRVLMHVSEAGEDRAS